MTHNKLRKQSGFTILELMIATVVFSIILLVVAAGILNFSNQYIKGITSSNTQAVARAVTADVVQTIQFSGGQVQPPTGSTPEEICINGNGYYYELGEMVTAGQHGLVKDTGSCSGSVDFTAVTLGSTQHELLNQNMRLADFSITQPSGGNSAEVTVSVASGADDLFQDGSGRVMPDPAFDWSTAHCKPGSGSQFCAVSRLTTFVQGRIGG